MHICYSAQSDVVVVEALCAEPLLVVECEGDIDLSRSERLFLLLGFSIFSFVLLFFLLLAFFLGILSEEPEVGRDSYTEGPVLLVPFSLHFSLARAIFSCESDLLCACIVETLAAK